MTSAFFYGILLHPKILKRVLNNDASHLQICPAILTVRPLPPSTSRAVDAPEKKTQHRAIRGTKSKYVGLLQRDFVWKAGTLMASCQCAGHCASQASRTSQRDFFPYSQRIERVFFSFSLRTTLLSFRESGERRS